MATIIAGHIAGRSALSRAIIVGALAVATGSIAMPGLIMPPWPYADAPIQEVCGGPGMDISIAAIPVDVPDWLIVSPRAALVRITNTPTIGHFSRRSTASGMAVAWSNVTEHTTQRWQY
jgi:hypothetical protein